MTAKKLLDAIVKNSISGEVNPRDWKQVLCVLDMQKDKVE